MKNYKNQIDEKGYFGKFGGAVLPPELKHEMTKIDKFYQQIKNDADFLNELKYIRKHFQGRPTPISFARNLSQKHGGAAIYLKREDLNHTGAHKLNHCMGEALLAKKMGKTKLIAETGAGQHGVALATAAAYFQMECEIHMGEVDISKESPNVSRMKILGAKIIPVKFGAKTLKEAVDSAFESYVKQIDSAFYAIGSVVGPHPFPQMVRDFQSVIGEESREQFIELTGKLPDKVLACVGGGSNAMGIFYGFLNDENVKLFGVEPLGRLKDIEKDIKGEHAATISFGKRGTLHGFESLVLTDEEGEPAPVHSIASGLDYPGVGPEHAFMHKIGRVKYLAINDQECLDAFFELSRLEGIIPALESAHAVAAAIKMAPKLSGQTILVNLSGRGDKDLDFVLSRTGKEKYASL